MQRFGISFGKKMHDDFVHLIQTNKATLLEKQSLRVSVYELTYNAYGQDTKFKVVYDKQRKTIVTILPPEAQGFSPGSYTQIIGKNNE